MAVRDRESTVARQRLPCPWRACRESCRFLLATAIDGLTTKEAGRLLGVPQGTVKTRLMRARAQLRAGLA